MTPSVMSTLRIIDANRNRIGEGLRFLEEMARMVLNNEAMTRRLKTMRHAILESDRELNQRLLQARESEGDVGITLKTPQEQEEDLLLLVVANARRVQESLRTMEELAKLPEVELDSDTFKQARFELYTIEQELFSRMTRQERAKLIKGVYVVLDTESLQGRSHVEIARQAIQGGAQIIQLRDKCLARSRLLPLAEELRKLCAEHGVLFVINDYLDIALAVDADGLHLGQDDLPLKVARRLLPIDKLVGISVTTTEQASEAVSGGADYIAVSAVYATPSKMDVDVVGMDVLRRIREVVTVPLVAIGGIDRGTVREVVEAGADAVAVIRAVLHADVPADEVRYLTAQFKQRRGK